MPRSEAKLERVDGRTTVRPGRGSLFDAESDPDDVAQTVPAPSGSGIIARDTPPSSSPRERLVRAMAPSFGTLDLFLAARIMRLDITMATCEDLRLIADARAVRASLARAAEFAAPTPSDDHTLEAVLAETIRGVYAWAIEELDAIFRAGPPRPLSERLFAAIVDHADAAEMRGKLDASLTPLEGTLADLAEACVRLGERAP